MQEWKAYCDVCGSDITGKKRWHLDEIRMRAVLDTHPPPPKDLDFCSLICLGKWLVKEPVKK